MEETASEATWIDCYLGREFWNISPAAPGPEEASRPVDAIGFEVHGAFNAAVF